MSIQTQVIIRSKKLGVLIRDARLLRRKTIPECASSIGMPAGMLLAWEEGRRSPSLPELEILAYALGLPLSQFWSKEARSNEAKTAAELDLQEIVKARQSLVGAQLRQAREEVGVTLRNLSERTGISMPRLKAYELGELPIPLPELEGLMVLLSKPIESLFDQAGPVGKWMAEQRAIADFLKIPRELQDFVTRVSNLPYVELAVKLSGMSSDKLRSVAEGLLEITL